MTLDNPFPVPSLCKLNHISVCFIQISTKITCKQLIPFRESHDFFDVIPGVLGRSVNFNITLRRPVFPDYPFLWTMIYMNVLKQPSSIRHAIMHVTKINEFHHGPFSGNFMKILEGSLSKARAKIYISVVYESLQERFIRKNIQILRTLLSCFCCRRLRGICSIGL